MSTLDDNLQEADGIIEESDKNSPEENDAATQDAKVGNPTSPIQLSTETADQLDHAPKEDNLSSKEVESAPNPNNNIEYNTMDLEALVLAFEKLLKVDDLYVIRQKVNQIKKAFNTKFNAQLKAAKTAFLAEGGNSIEFSFDNP